MSKIIKFFYVYRWLKQKALLEGMPDINVKEEIGVGHVSLDDVLLCGVDREALKKESGATGYFTVGTWRKGVPVCHACQEAWKKMRGSPWKQWENQEVKRV